MNTIMDTSRSSNNFLNIDIGSDGGGFGLKRDNTVNSHNVSDNILGGALDSNLDANTSKGTSNHDNILAQISKSNTLMTEQLEDQGNQKISAKYSLVLKEDYYSLAFYGFFLDSEQEELSAHKHSKKANEILKSRSKNDA
jgi:hypothetical protein